MRGNWRLQCVLLRATCTQPLHAQAANISKERLASFDRPIVSDRILRNREFPVVQLDLSAYLQTLKALPSPPSPSRPSTGLLRFET